MTKARVPVSSSTRDSDQDAVLRNRVIDQVTANLEKIGPIPPGMVLGISVADLRRANQYSSRPGGSVSIDFMLAGERYRKTIWMKQTVSPREVYFAMSTMHSAATESHIAGPIPEPYFYDEDMGLVFMEHVDGENLGKLALIYGMRLNLLPNRRLPELFSQMGRWLQAFHSSYQTGESEDLKTVIAGIRERIHSSTQFSQREKDGISEVLERIESRPISEVPFPMVRSHNAFTLRNIFVEPDYSFHLVDWDAMVNPKYPKLAMCWWDLTTLYLNIQSLLRIHPATSKRRIRELCDGVVQGYLTEQWIDQGVFVEDFRESILYVVALKYYLGLGTARPLHKVYSQNFGARYAAKLRRALLEGRGDIA